MTSKFRLPPRTATPEQRPTSLEEFANDAGMVHSQQPPRPLKPVRLNVELEPSLHERAKLRAAELRMTSAQYVRELISMDLRDRILE